VPPHDALEELDEFGLGGEPVSVHAINRFEQQVVERLGSVRGHDHERPSFLDRSDEGSQRGDVAATRAVSV
jgi:hypothetical protein